MASGADYGTVYDSFDWDSVLESYDWHAPDELNTAHEACDRHAGSGEVGFAWVPEGGDLVEYTFAELRDRSNRVANALTALGVERGDRVSTLLPKIPETIVTVLGIWKTGAIHVPLFTAFERGALEYRIDDCDPELLIYEADQADTVASLDAVDDVGTVVVGGEPPADSRAFEALLADRSA
jgi:acetyl-CoA synthetase